MAARAAIQESPWTRPSFPACCSTAPRRLHFAKLLIDWTDLPMTEVALEAGYCSLRRVNAVIRESYRRSPSQLRRRSGNGEARRAGIVLRLPYRALWIVLLQVPSAFIDPELLRSPRWARTFETLALSGAALILAGLASEPPRSGCVGAQPRLAATNRSGSEGREWSSIGLQRPRHAAAIASISRSHFSSYIPVMITVSAG